MRDFTFRRYIHTANPARAASAASPNTAGVPLRSTPAIAGLDSRPVIESPAVTARNQTPIICEAYFAGAIFVVTDRPTGERHSSPTVWMKERPSSHIGLTTVPFAAMAIGTRKKKNETPARTRPIANFTMVPGSLPLRFSHTHSQAKTGASAMMNSGFSDWYQEVGKSKPSSEPAVFWSFEPNAWTVDAPWS